MLTMRLVTTPHAEPLLWRRAGLERVDNNGLWQEERTELLINRCFMVTERPHTELWPFYDTLITA
jgi:hypothetical protein